MKQQDQLRRFLFENAGVRGEWVRLEKSWSQAKQYQKIVNSAVESQLGQALAAAVLLSATIKFKGALILQAQGDGDLKTLVAQSTHDRKVRALVRSTDEVSGETLQQMMGQGHLVITIESEIGEPYQGIVPLEQPTLAGLLETYFKQSEQLETRLWLFANDTHAAGLMIQELPDQENYQKDWERISVLAHTITEQEMLSLDSEEILHRLFHEEQVRVFEPEPVQFYCSCSKDKTAETLVTLGQDELQRLLKEQGEVTVGCQFCGQTYHFDRQALESLLEKVSATLENPETRH
ncbi:Hsp33 family molecular chaperone HslO [methane-oxidizing endosymbiont of Gigantopelta aegis]|uniref:Hsp33 family molecular chaperone HslO n=1 Tax=methane-oxidizing endosymbiont of Gigantopelta aegis TaxID=2794938 RepID=UPI0018DE091E|nr:Hsp33 family molecular chaperone HslO [methane-oxidizing endosymbiont of Gigantopelta aegis]